MNREKGAICLCFGVLAGIPICLLLPRCEGLGCLRLVHVLEQSDVTTYIRARLHTIYHMEDTSCAETGSVLAHVHSCYRMHHVGQI